MNDKHGFGALIAATAVACVAGCAPPSAPASTGDPARADFHSQCPLAVDHPSVTPAFDAARWNAMLAAARTSPPPYAPAATDFAREAVIVVALPRTPTPTTTVRLAPTGTSYDVAAGRWNLALNVEQRTAGAGQVGVMVVGEPCLVAWVPARAGVREIVARDTGGGATIGRWSRAQ